MSFALTLFVEAASRQISLPVTVHDVDEVCGYLFNTLCADLDILPAAEHPRAEDQSALYAAFRSLCGHYDGDPLQAAVCARVLAFYFLMERSAGAAVADWVRSHPETPQVVELHPAVIEAIATVRLCGSVLLSASAFTRLVAEKATTTRGIQ